MIHLEKWRLLPLLVKLLSFNLVGGQKTTTSTTTTTTTPSPLPPIHFEHEPPRDIPPRLPGMAEDFETPDFRIEEDTWYVQKPYRDLFMEYNRPYRISPHYKQMIGFGDHKDHPHLLGCYCTTVFRRLTVLAGCAVITSRHILTTATSTELVLSKYRDAKTLEDILGAWYDTDDDTFNSSFYMTPARIHYHPRFHYPHEVNHTHPLPFTFDLAVWAGTHTFKHAPTGLGNAQICSRGGPQKYQFLPSTPRDGDIALVVGFQFMKAFRRVPKPWFKYVIRTREHTVPCPKVQTTSSLQLLSDKSLNCVPAAILSLTARRILGLTDWGWMHCIPNSFWGKYGVESGAAWHRALENRYWIYDGLIGLCAFSMRLRSEEITHYFTVLNSHPVLDFLYSSYMGRLPYKFLDYRFYDTQWRAPWKKPWAIIKGNFEFGTNNYDASNLPVY